MKVLDGQSCEDANDFQRSESEFCRFLAVCECGAEFSENFARLAPVVVELDELRVVFG